MWVDDGCMCAGLGLYILYVAIVLLVSSHQMGSFRK